MQSGGSLRAGAGLLSPTAGWGAAAAPVAYGAAAVTGPGYGGTGADRQQQQQQRQRGSGRPQGSSRSSGATEVISLLDDEDDPPPLAARLASRGAPAAALPVAPAAAVLPSRAHGSPAGHGGAAMEVQGRGGVGAASDADLALMVEMGFSDKKARKVDAKHYRSSQGQTENATGEQTSLSLLAPADYIVPSTFCQTCNARVAFLDILAANIATRLPFRAHAGFAPRL